jgi:hypothetical protein
MKLRIAIALAGVMAIAPAAAHAVTAAPSSTTLPALVYLDSYKPNAPHDGVAGPVKIGQPNGVTPPGRLLVAEVKGTISYWYWKTWSHPTLQSPFTKICGTPENAPIFPSPGRHSGHVGIDPEYIFSRPWSKGQCAKFPVPRHTAAFQISNGGPYAHVEPLGGHPTAPASNHRYDYPIKSTGGVIKFQLLDAPGTADNYGRFRIILRNATAADCAGNNWQQFGMPSQSACETRAASQV